MKKLSEYLETIDTSVETFDYDEFIKDIKKQFPGYHIETWDWDDYEAGDAAESMIEWIADYTIDKEVKDIQSGTFWIVDEEDIEKTCYTVVICKTK